VRATVVPVVLLAAGSFAGVAGSAALLSFAYTMSATWLANPLGSASAELQSTATESVVPDRLLKSLKYGGFFLQTFTFCPTIHYL